MRVLRVVGSGQPPSPAADVDADEAGDTLDDARLLVADDEGEQYLLTVDDALVAACAAVRATSPEPEPVAITHLSPRDIQTRIRAGESPEDLAAETGMDVDRVLRFGFAVMQERSRVGDEARRARARRDGDGALVPFGETVDRRFSAHGIDPADVGWDAFRRPDGSWTISATWTNGSGSRQAYWAFSLGARTVLPADEAAADLLSDRPLRAVVRAVPDTAAPSARPVDDAVFDQESPGGYTRATDSGRSAANVPVGDGYGTPPLPLRLADPLPEPSPMTGSADEPSEGAGAKTGASVHVLGARAKLAPESAEESLTDILLGQPPAAEATDAEPAAADPTPSPEPPATPAPRRRTGREQVPSWDDILLGVRRKRD